TEESIRDDRGFSTAAIGASVGAAATGGAIMANKRKDDDIHQELNRGDVAPSTGQHEAAAYNAGTAMNQGEPSQLESADKQFSPSQQSYSLAVNKSNIHPGDAAIGGVAGGVGGAEIPSSL